MISGVGKCLLTSCSIGRIGLSVATNINEILGRGNAAPAFKVLLGGLKMLSQDIMDAPVDKQREAWGGRGVILNPLA